MYLFHEPVCICVMSLCVCVWRAGGRGLKRWDVTLGVRRPSFFMACICREGHGV